MFSSSFKEIIKKQIAVYTNDNVILSLLNILTFSILKIIILLILYNEIYTILHVAN